MEKMENNVDTAFLEQIKVLQELKIKTPLHQELLKKTLCSRQRKRKFFHFPLKLLKIVLPIGILAILGVTITFTYIYTFNTPVSAQDLIQQKIKNIEQIHPQTAEEENKRELIITVLDEALQSKELKEIGVKEMSGKNVRELQFTDPDLSNDIILQIDPTENSLDSVSFRFERIQPAIDFVSEEVVNGKVMNLDDLTKKLKDPNLKQDWVKQIIKIENEKFIQEHSSDPLYKNIIEQIAPAIRSSEVLIAGIGGEGGKDGKLVWMNLNVYSVSGQLNKLTKARGILKNALHKLERFSSEKARRKIALLQIALQSPDLIHYSWEDVEPYDRLSFSYKDIKNINILIDDAQATEDFIRFQFGSSGHFILDMVKDFPKESRPKDLREISLKIKDGKIINSEELRQALQAPQNVFPKDPLILALIKEQNELWIEDISHYNWLEKIYGINGDFIKNELGPYIESATVLVGGPNFSETPKDFDLIISPFEEPLMNKW